MVAALTGHPEGMSRRATNPRMLGCERGQTAAEYMGMLLIVAVIIGALFRSGLPGDIVSATAGMVDKIAGGGGSGGQTGGGPGGPGGPGGTGGPGDPGGSNDPGGNDPGGPDGTALATCLSSGKAYGYCLKAFDPARYLVETRPSEQLKRVDAATKALLNSGARPGTPEYEALVRARQKAVTEYLATKPTASNKILKALNNTKKLLDPRARDAEDIAKAARDFQAKRALANGVPKPAPKPGLPNTASGGPKTSTSASKFLKGAGKVAKGLGVVGTALGLYTNVKEDGVAKGVTETAGGVAGAWGASTVVAMGCAALAVTGVGAIACGVGVIAAGVIGSEVGRRATGWAYDHAIAPAGRAIKNVTVGAAKKVAEGGKKLAEGAGKVASALNPFD